MAKTTLSNVVEELELQTEYLDLQESNLRSFGETLKAQAQADAAKNARDNLDDLEASREAGPSDAATGAKLKGGKSGEGFASSFGSSFGGMAGAAAGLGALGMGIGAFFGGLALGDAALSYANTDMSALKRAMVGLGEAFDETPTKGLIVMGGLMAAGGALGALFGPGKSMKAGFGMFAIGAGIGGFFAGLSLGAAGIDILNTDASSLVPVMKNVAEGLGAFASNPGALAVLSGMLAAGGLFAMVPGGSGAMVTGMAAIGIGIGAFFTAMGAASAAINLMGADGSGLKNLMKNTAEGLNELTKVDYTKFDGFLSAAGSVGAGMLLLMGTSGIGQLTQSLGSLMDAITPGENKSIYEATAEGLTALMDVDYSKLDNFDKSADALGRFTSAITKLGDADLSDLKSNIDEIGLATAHAIPLFDKMWNGGKMGDGFFDGYPEMDFGGGLKALPMKEIGESLNVIGSGINTQRSDAIAANTDPGGGGGSTIINNVSSPTNTQIQTQIGTESPQLGSVTHGNGSQADAYAAA